MKHILILIALITLIMTPGCEEQPAEQSVHLTTGKLGMWINPKEGDMAHYDEALSLAREAQVQLAHVYVQWGLVEKSKDEYDWKIPDYILGKFEKYGFEAVVVIPVIFTTKLDVMPSDLQFAGFSDPEIVSRFVKFSEQFLERYKSTVKYLIIGNEVDVYLSLHPECITDFKALVEAVARISDIPVGTELAIHSVVQSKTEDIARRVIAGDMVFYTLYPTGENFSFGGHVEDAATYFDAMFTLAGSRKIAVVETSWSSSPSLESSEETQAQYIKELFQILTQNRDRIEFLMWITLYDSTPQECEESAKFFVTGVNDQMLKDKKTMGRFAEFMCHLGLRRTDGTPKPAWYQWLAQVEAYYTSYQ
ncbi:MAG: hypothetical protein WBA22_16500 [Candidatus Methanofastidiosia archaeon]